MKKPHKSPKPKQKRLRRKPSQHGHFSHGLLTEVDAQKVKERLWYGESTIRIAKSLGTSSAAIVNIYGGMRWAGVPWPDTSRGSISATRKKLIDTIRKDIFENRVPSLVRAALRLHEARVKRAPKK